MKKQISKFIKIIIYIYFSKYIFFLEQKKINEKSVLDFKNFEIFLSQEFLYKVQNFYFTIQKIRFQFVFNKNITTFITMFH